MLASDSDNEEEIEILGDKVASIELYPDLSMEEARQVIVKTVLNRSWAIVEEDEEAGIVVVNLVHRRHDSTLYLVYTTDSLTIHSDSWRINRSGERMRRDHPSGWINNIEKDVKVFWQRRAADL
ncbi:MAG: hypothetical protein JJU20_11075 [Opitutales bacterium]|nr:hypothetical protein [Opitutales bacterium]